MTTLLATPATAQDDGFSDDTVAAITTSPSEGIAPPVSTIVDRDDALSLELNPAGLRHIKGFELMGIGADFSDNRNEGFGLLMAMSLFDGVGIGYGLQMVGIGNENGDAQTFDPYRKHTVGLGFGDRLALGINANFFGSSTNKQLDDLVSWDVGIQYRMMRWLGFGLFLRDANVPFLGDEPIDSQLTLGMAIRPFDGRLMVESDVTFYNNSERVQPRLVLSIEAIDGLRVFGQVVGDTGQQGDNFEINEFSAGLEMNLPNAGFGGVGVGGTDNLSGYSATVRLSSAAWRPLFDTGKRFQTVKIGGNPPERAPVDFLGQPTGRSFLQTLRRIQKMREDPQVEGIVLELRGVSMGYGQAWELRTELERFKAAGKPIVAYMHTPGQREFYLATVADHVWMGPMTTFVARGLAITQTFYRGAFDKLGVEADFIRIAEYKSAPESFTRETPSESNEEALNAFLDSIWDYQLETIANARGMGVERLQGLINTTPHDPGDALQQGLVDKVIYPDEIPAAVKEIYGARTTISQRYGRLKKDYAWATSPAVLVIHVDGTIVTGAGGVNPLLGSTLTGDRTIDKIAKWAGANPLIKGVVVRIDSPGGSATASDLMHRSLSELAKKKPLVVSMGDVAASGGYYVAATGKEIFCNPTTLTGSIGIYSGKFALRGLYNKVGYNSLVNKRGDRADLYDLSDPWDEQERAAILEQITYLYELFLSQVSAGRDMERDAIHKVAKGRIWSGIDAQRVGLCDVHGGILDAIEKVRIDAGLDADDMKVVELPSGTVSGLLPDIGVNVGIDFAQASLFNAPMSPVIPEAATDAQIYQAYGPVRDLLNPLRPALDLAVIFKDGESLALLPFATDW